MSTHDRQSDVEWFAVPSLGCSCYFIYAQVPCNFTPANDLGPVGLPPGLCAAFTFHSVITLYALAALAACCCMPCCRLYHSLTIAACCCMPCCRLYHSLTIAATISAGYPNVRAFGSSACVMCPASLGFGAMCMRACGCLSAHEFR